MPSFADPQSLNRYSYTNNNPAKFIDPSGHYPCMPYDDYCTINLYNLSPSSDLSEDLNQADDPPCAYSDSVRRCEEIANWEASVREYIETELFNENKKLRVRFTDLEAMAFIADYTAGLVKDDWDAMLLILSSVFLDVHKYGPGTLIEANNTAGNGDYKFFDEGFNISYQDDSNQIYHSWGYVANVAAPGDFQTGFAGYEQARASNVLHEIPFINSGSSIEDYRLSLAAINVGNNITGLTIDTSELGDLLLEAFGE